MKPADPRWRRAAIAKGNRRATAYGDEARGPSTQAISKLTGYDRKTVLKYLLKPETAPRYGPRLKRGSKLDTHKPYLQDRMKAGVWNAQVLLRELRKLGYQGGYTILKDWLQPQRPPGWRPRCAGSKHRPASRCRWTGVI